jgi:hypothetical protein
VIQRISIELSELAKLGERLPSTVVADTLATLYGAVDDGALSIAENRKC